MRQSLFSQSWYKVAELKPRLRSHAQIHRHTYRGKDWYVLQDHSTGRFHRFSPQVYLIIGLMDGRRTLKEIWDAACGSLGDDMPTQDEVVGVLAQLHRADVLQADIPPDISDLHLRHQTWRRSRWVSFLRSPMAIRFPLLDPDRFLDRTQFLVRPLFSWVGMLLWCIVVGTALFYVPMHWDDLTANLADRVLSLENLLLLWLVYPIVKTLHEFGHAYMVKRWGGEVHEMGIMLLVLMPIPYVDASSSSALWDKRKRMLVGGAGILVEGFLAAVAMFVWMNVETGAVRAVAYNVMLIAGVSTLFFNGNPLLRFDAYYVLGDFLEIPNLGTRANRYLGYLLQRYLFWVSNLQTPAASSGEAGWLLFYAVASFVYRIFISVRIILFVAGKFFVIGVVLAIWAASSMLVFPFMRVLRLLFTDGRLQARRVRIVLTSALISGLLAVLVFWVPFPIFTMAEGVVWVPEQSQIYAGAAGFVRQVVATPGAAVAQGDLLVRCEDPELATRVAVLEARLRELDARHRLSVVTDRTEAEVVKDEMQRVRAELRRARERQKELMIHSPVAGTFLLPQVEDWPDRFVQRGAPVGYVVDFSEVIVRIVVPQSDVDRVRHTTRKLEARLSESIDRIIPSLMAREVPAASKKLPSLALSLEGGGAIALDPRENEEPQAFEKHFHFEIELPQVAINRVGERVYVRFEHDPEPLAYRWYQDVRRLLLRRFDI